MKQTFRTIISASAVSALAFSAVAQDAPRPNTERPAYNSGSLQDASQPNTDRPGDRDLDRRNNRLQDGSETSADRPGDRARDRINNSLQDASESTADRPGERDRNRANNRLQDGSESTADRLGERDSNRVNSRFQDSSETNTDRLGSRDGNLTHRASRGEQIQGIAKASDLIGMTIKNRQDETVGEVQDLALDVQSGRIVALIVSSGGFLGIGDELSAVPPTALRFNADRDTLQIDASKEMLSNAPHFKSDEWPDLGQSEYAGEIYGAYQVEPYFTTNATTKVDNTARNVRDRDDATLTSFDQGNSKVDVDTTAKIRKEINDSENMSISGKNVKIITKDGQVTLRGPVNSAEEKRLIGEIANRNARSGNVDNQLEVKRTTTTTSIN